MLVLAGAACAGCAARTASSPPVTTVTATTQVSAVVRGNPEPLGPCQPTPAPGAAPPWMPADLALPTGSYPVAELAPEGPARKASFVVPMAPDDFSAFALKTWPADGWRLGRPESEGFEGENRFTRPPAYGGFKVRAVYCDKAVSELTLAYSPTS